MTVPFASSIYLIQETMWPFCHVDTLFTKTAWRRCGIIFNMLALSAPSLFVICPRYGRNLTWRLQLHQCQNLIKIEWFGFFAMTAGKHQKCSTMSWLINAWTANPTTLAKQEAEHLTVAITDWQSNDSYNCAKIGCIHNPRFPRPILITRAMFIGKRELLSTVLLLQPGLCHEICHDPLAFNCFLCCFFLYLPLK